MRSLVYVPDLLLAVLAVFAGVYHGIVTAVAVMVFWVILLLYRVLVKLYHIRRALVQLDLVVPVLQTFVGKRPGEEAGPP